MEVDDAAIARGVQRDPRLIDCITHLAVDAEQRSFAQHCSALWACGMIFDSAQSTPSDVRQWAAEVSRRASAEALNGVPAHEVAAAAWGCETLAVEPSVAMCTRSSEVPFKLHVGAVGRALEQIASTRDGAVSELAAQLPLRRDAVVSGSAEPSATSIVEDRDTCWLSDAGVAFAYSGKSMAAEGTLHDTEGVAVVRDAVHASIGDLYDSVLINHYPDGTSGMRFHSDPGQGPGASTAGAGEAEQGGGWGYSTAVVSVGGTRLFTFRRIGQPEVRVTFAVRHGDCLHMYADCQRTWQHSVVREQPGRGLSARAPRGAEGRHVPSTTSGKRQSPQSHGVGEARISLVFKRTFEAEVRAMEGE